MDTEKMRRGAACLLVGGLFWLLWALASSEAAGKETFGMGAFTLTVVGVLYLASGLLKD